MAKRAAKSDWKGPNRRYVALSGLATSTGGGNTLGADLSAKPFRAYTIGNRFHYACECLPFIFTSRLSHHSTLLRDDNENNSENCGPISVLTLGTSLGFIRNPRQAKLMSRPTCGRCFSLLVVRLSGIRFALLWHGMTEGTETSIYLL